MTLGNEDIREVLTERSTPLAEKRWPWIVSAASVILIGVLSATSGAQVPLLGLVDFGVHEFGHLLFAWAPWRVATFAGSGLQVAVPLALALYFALWRCELWAAAPLFAWAGASLRNVAVYVADAPYQRLELWGGDNVTHDWAQLLAGRAMQHAEQIAWLANACGWLLIAGGFILAVAPPVVMARERAQDTAEEARLETLPVRDPRGPIG